MAPWIRYGFLTADFRSHEHLVWEFHVGFGGRAVFVQEGREDVLEEGSLVVSAPGQAHAIRVANSFMFHYIRLDPHPEDVALLAELRSGQKIHGPLKMGKSGLETLVAIRRKLDSDQARSRISAELRFRSWLYELDYEEGDGGSETRGDGIDRALAFMRQNLDRRLGLDELATLAGMDRAYFCRRFHRRMGRPPLAWFQAARIEAASFLLADNQLSLAEVARRFAFCDEFHFSKVFRSHMGMPPGQFRSRI
jgi:AraC-like DNA-binding protein